MKSKTSSPDMLHWQYKTILGQIDQVTLHASDDSCPCNQVALDPPEYCLGKHLLDVSTLASETSLMDEPHRDMLEGLASEASAYHEKAKEIYCKGGTWPDLEAWSRSWRKKLEPIYYACDTRKKAKVHDVEEPEQNVANPTEKEVTMADVIKEVSGEVKSSVDMESPKQPYVKPLPKAVIVYRSTIEKHYRATADMHKGSIRTIKQPGSLTTLGCPKGVAWEPPKSCGRQELVMTIVPNTKKYREELKHLIEIHPEVEAHVQYRDRETGIRPQLSEAEEEEKANISAALNKVETVEV
jgi:hypothetical protein